jgi:hypothetical protein
MELIAQWRNLWAFLIGMLGSVAYFTVVYFGLLGTGRENREYILFFFRRRRDRGVEPGSLEREGAASASPGDSGLDPRLDPMKVGWYGVIGGFIAGIFQLPEATFVPIQSFVLGATWPSIVGQFLSSRQTVQPPEDRRAELGLGARDILEATTAKQRATEQAGAVLKELRLGDEDISRASAEKGQAAERAAAILQELEGVAGEGQPAIEPRAGRAEETRGEQEGQGSEREQ